MSFIEAIKSVLTQFKNFHGRARRSEYWWLLPALIPVAGQIYMMIWFLKDSQPGDNQYGPNPKGQ